MQTCRLASTVNQPKLENSALKKDPGVDGEPSAPGGSSSGRDTPGGILAGGGTLDRCGRPSGVAAMTTKVNDIEQCLKAPVVVTVAGRCDWHPVGKAPGCGWGPDRFLQQGIPSPKHQEHRGCGRLQGCFGAGEGGGATNCVSPRAGCSVAVFVPRLYPEGTPLRTLLLALSMARLGTQHRS